ncbi:auxin response factor protein [Dioscorea alata]|uniref:Auxin response factor protein n=1 Tax=Dioscorea alata TaxID=55571 RepID=A0ACB7TV08_DIOAL|nr:auxin response factor protein [Dioscorea alata]
MAYASAGGSVEGIYEELWRACAGPLVEIPRVGERVFYFPQGHMEQLEATMNHELNQQVPLFKLPTKILCRVVHIQLKAESETDEVYAQITLLPEPDQNELKSPDPCQPEPLRPGVSSFYKILTASDTSTHGGFSVRRRHANDCLPPLDMSQPIPNQELIAKDLHGFEWRFKHIFRGQPRRHLLTTGWSTFVTSKRLVAGDVFIFMRGENGELLVGLRRLARQQSTIPSSVISSQSMHLGVLATASHAVSTQSLFTVYYKPRTSQFIVSVNKYYKAVNDGLKIGMRFKMKFEGDDVPEKSFAGTIVGIGDISPHWGGSKWRSLKVQWDEHTNIRRPDRVSPWDVELLNASVPVTKVTEPVPAKNKRSHSMIDLRALVRQGTLKDRSPEHPTEPLWFPGGTQPKHDLASVCSTNTPSGEKQTVSPYKQEENRSNRIMNSLSSYNSGEYNAWSVGLNSPLKSPSSSVLTDASPKEVQDGNDLKATLPSWLWASSSCLTEDSLLKQNNMERGKNPEVSNGCRLFGFELVQTASSTAPVEKVTAGLISAPGATNEHPAVVISNSVKDSSTNSVLMNVAKQQKHVPQISPNECLSRQSLYTRSRTKVHMQGIAVGRAIDLTNLEGYNELIMELEEMFDIKGELRNRDKWAVVFTDNEDDMMLVGDDPWPEFCKMVKKIFIYGSEEVKKMRPGSKLPAAITVEGG